MTDQSETDEPCPLCGVVHRLSPNHLLATNQRATMIQNNDVMKADRILVAYERGDMDVVGTIEDLYDLIVAQSAPPPTDPDLTTAIAKLLDERGYSWGDTDTIEAIAALVRPPLGEIGIVLALARRALALDDPATVERVARAICWAENGQDRDCNTACLNTNQCAGPLSECFKRDARAAIAALKGTTDEQ